MVALHNRRLTARDIWPDILWDDKAWHQKRDEIEAQVRAEGIVAPMLFFEISRRMEAYARQFPGLRGRQEVMAAIYPPKKGTGLFTEEEREYLRMKLARANDPVAEAILKKLGIER